MSHKHLSDAIKATAKMYGIDAEAALAALETLNSTHSVLLRSAADGIVMTIHEADHLAATQKSATKVIADQAAMAAEALPGVVPRSVGGKAAAAAKAVAAAIAKDLAGEVLNPTGNVWAAINTAVQKYRGTITNAELGPVVDAAITAGIKAARADDATAKTVAAAVQTALAAAYAQVASATGNNLPQVGADGMLVMAKKTPPTPTEPTEPTKTDPAKPVMTMAQKIDALLENADAMNFGLTGGNYIEALSFGGTASKHGKVSYQPGTATVAGTKGGRYPGQFGYWLDESFVIGVLKAYKGDDNDEPLAFSIGVPANTNPTGTGGEKMRWNGAVTGYWTPGGGSPMDANGRARITVTFPEALGANPMAMLEIPTVKTGDVSVNINDEDWESIQVMKGEFSATGVEGRFLDGHTAVVGELDHTQSAAVAVAASGDNPGTPAYLAGTLDAAFGAVK